MKARRIILAGAALALTACEAAKAVETSAEADSIRASADLVSAEAISATMASQSRSIDRLVDALSSGAAAASFSTMILAIVLGGLAAAAVVVVLLLLAKRKEVVYQIAPDPQTAYTLPQMTVQLPPAETWPEHRAAIRAAQSNPELAVRLIEEWKRRDARRLPPPEDR